MTAVAANEASQTMLSDLQAALADDQVRFELVRTFGAGDAVRVEHRAYRGRWQTIKTLIFPPKGEPISAVFAMLIEMRGGES